MTPELETYSAELKYENHVVVSELVPVGTGPAVGAVGTMHGFGNTLPRACELSVGWRERGRPEDGRWNALLGTGWVREQAGEYAPALQGGAEVAVLLFETFGGFSAPVVELLQKAGAEVENRLSHAQYDATTWSARTWMSYSTQQLSVSLQLAVAWEAAKAMGVPGLGAGRDVRSVARSGAEAASDVGAA